MKNANRDFKTRITAFVLSLIVLTAVGLCSFPTVSYADTTLNFDGIKDAQYSNWESLPDDFKELGQAYYYFLKSKDGLDMIKNASEIPISWFKVLKDGTPVISPLGQLFYYLDGGELFVEDKSADGHHTSGGAGRHRAGNTNPVLPAEILVDTINNNTTVVIPSVQTFDRSWANNPLSVSGYDNKRTADYFTFLNNDNFFGIDGCKSIYGLPYIELDGVKYYSSKVYHFMYANELYEYGKGVSESETLYPVLDVYYSFPSEDNPDPYRLYFQNASYITSYALFRSQPSSNLFYGFTFGSSEWYNTAFSMAQSSAKSMGLYSISDKLECIFIDNSKFSSPKFFSASNIGETLSVYSFFYGDSDLGIEKPDFTGSVSDKNYNFGFELSTQRFHLGSLSSFIDGSRIPSNSYITITGDSVYDYSITNNDTGDTTDFGSFVNNGYAWINTGSGTQNNGSGNGGNVSGSVDLNVSGSVDINVNVNGGGNGQNPNDYIDPSSGVDTSLDNYLQYVPEVSKGFIDYLKDFFTWLPLPIYGLLILGLIVAIFCRLTGR